MKLPFAGALLMLVVPLVALSAPETKQTLTVSSYLASHGLGRLSQSGRTKRMYDSIFSRLGVDYRLVSLPYLRSARMANTGDVDVVMALEATYFGGHLISHPEGVVIVEEAQSLTRKVLVVQDSKALEKPRPKVAALRFFAGIKPLLDKNGYDTLLLDTYGNLFKAVKAGRVDGMMMSNYLFHRLSQFYDPEGELKVAGSIGCSRTFMAYSIASLGEKRARELAEESARVVRELKAVTPELFVSECEPV